MTARASRRKTSSKGPTRRRSKGDTARLPGLATMGRFGTWITSIEAPTGLKREVLALSAVTAAILLGIALAQPESGALVGLIGGGLLALLGRGAVLVPLALLWLAGEALFSRNSGTRRRRFIGYALLSISIISFFHLIAAPNGVPAGGYLGSGFAEILRLLTGDAGAGVILFSTGLVGVYFLTGADAVSVVQTWRRAQAARQARRKAAEAARVSASGTNELVRPPEQSSEKTEKSRPVIAVPKRRAAPLFEKDISDESPAERKSDRPLPLPDLNRLTQYEGGTPEAKELEAKAELIEETLNNFKVAATVREIHPGPAVTLFTLKPGPGVKVRRITELQNDLALALAAPSIRIEAPVPGMARVGVEIPNKTVHTVGLRETMESPEFRSSKARLPLALGRDVNGSYRIADLTKMPHLLIAGATGSGKSVCINGIIATFLLHCRPDDLRLVMIDPKMVELAGFNGVPHLKGPVVTEMDKVVAALRMVLREMEERYQRFSALGVRNIDGYNLRRAEDPSLEKLPYLVVVIDELADLMMTAPDDVETLLVRLAQMARATGIHLLVATQRPSVDVITGLIKANVPARIAFAVTSQTDSRVILDLPGAERLLGKGDMLFLPPDAAKPHRMQGSFIDDKDLQYLVGHWKRVCPNHRYDPEWQDLPGADEGGGGDPDDDLLEEAEAIIRQQGTASASMLQRRLRIGYNRASRLIEQLEADGLVGPADGSRGRRVLVGDDD
jgi:DNA segregation ATPase FtsK/SpoIIIE, S-DNA-T family